MTDPFSEARLGKADDDLHSMYVKEEVVVPYAELYSLTSGHIKAIGVPKSWNERHARLAKAVLFAYDAIEERDAQIILLKRQLEMAQQRLEEPTPNGFTDWRGPTEVEI